MHLTKILFTSMKKVNYYLKSGIALIFLGSMLLTSCSGETDERKPKSSEISNGDSARIDIDTNHVLAWESMRKNTDSVKLCFSELTNTFSITRPDSTVDSIYVYIGYNSRNKTLRFYAIASFADTLGNLKCIDTSSLIQGAKVPLAITTAKDPSRKDAITLQDARDRIGYWTDSDIRNSWIEAVSDSSEGHMMGQVFVIQSVDMVPKDKHTCYLALAKDPTALGGYRGDLIIVNTRTHEIVQPAPVKGDLSGVLEDVVYLSPPFKSIDKNSFGLLKTLGIR